ncbi:MAG: alpha,alpha-phosphotrehalase [Gammaproteobacteria bacterium]|nr:alpha,alpha-phosphotrehalase [Gammaproteobacteria bacterium]
MSYPQHDWWRQAVVYQIYPKSFQDSGDKGTGDLQGIIRRLDYLQQLGVDALWITPIYCSPQVDNGYDIADYYAIDPTFGGMTDFEQLVAACKQRNMHIIMDMVFNHTSTEHVWFKTALSDPQSRFRDFYIWRDPVNGKAPNNWQSKFGGNAWTFDPPSGQYYLHLFSEQQADLNWENPEVREEIKKVLHFWADKGVDGFRLDVINLISKQQDFCDDFTGDGRRFYTDGPRVHEHLQELSRDVFQPRGCMTVGEMSSTTLEHCQQYSQQDGRELSMVFNFHHLKVDYPNGEKWQLAEPDFIELKQIFAKWQNGLHQQGWSALFWCNHDQPRIVSRFGHEGEYREKSAKMLATALHMLQGTPYIYQGEEIGMTNPHFSRIDDYRDVESLNLYLAHQQQKIPAEETLQILAARSRDNSRTPMPWDASPGAGFSQGTSWIPLGDNAGEVNVAKALADKNSVFYYYQHLIQLRKQQPVIVNGNYQDLQPDNPDLWCYQRDDGQSKLLVVANLRATATPFVLPEHGLQTTSECLIHNSETLPELCSRELQPYEIMVWLSK